MKSGNDREEKWSRIKKRFKSPKFKVRRERLDYALHSVYVPMHFYLMFWFGWKKKKKMEFKGSSFGKGSWYTSCHGGPGHVQGYTKVRDVEMFYRRFVNPICVSTTSWHLPLIMVRWEDSALSGMDPGQLWQCTPALEEMGLPKALKKMEKMLRPQWCIQGHTRAAKLFFLCSSKNSHLNLCLSHFFLKMFWWHIHVLLKMNSKMSTPLPSPTLGALSNSYANRVCSYPLPQPFHFQALIL